MHLVNTNTIDDFEIAIKYIVWIVAAEANGKLLYFMYRQHDVNT